MKLPCRRIGFLLKWLCLSSVMAQQIDIPRIEHMPNEPAPYLMRNWKSVALGYDSIAFDFDRSGLYLPLIFWNTSPVNYPNHISFGLHSYVGTDSPENAECINVLPAVIGASLVGIDKSNQNGMNWVLLCEEWFNRREEENVYLNSPVSTSGSDWWYDTMPNLLFYQLYSLYPPQGDFEYQFISIADQWLRAVETMGGSTTPWKKPNMNYRAWSLSTMQPLISGVKEPEAAGAIGWLLYQAYIRTGEEKYRIGAEWALEFLNSLSRNPSYELQLPYGVAVAARMNATLGTEYDIEKMVNWCFDPEDNVREWGATLGNWGGYDCYGLIGEAKYSGYAFIMNGFEMTGALVPMVRYDDHFARAIGKWVLNLANASRLFYAKYLPDQKQDSEAWSHQYDPQYTISHESMQESWMGISPYATGDAISGGWAETNLALYGSSHVGILGGIVDTTNVEKLLRLDVLKTDYFHDPSFPTYLYFNPFEEQKEVILDVGSGVYDLYDGVSNQFVKSGVTGASSFSISSNSASLITVVPSGGVLTYDLDKMSIDGIVVDYSSGQTVSDYPPRIKSLSARYPEVARRQVLTLYCTACDREDASLDYQWEADGGTLSGQGAEVAWTSPDTFGTVRITCRVVDDQCGSDTAGIDIHVISNRNPSITLLTAKPKRLDLNASSVLHCTAADPDGDSLEYHWTAPIGSFTGQGPSVTWIAPSSAGHYFIACRIDDGHGGEGIDSIGVVVQDFSNMGTGVPILYFPFNGNADDESGFGNHGTVYGAAPVSDRFGDLNSAYSFDGVNDHIRVSNCPLLNFQDAISVSFWMSIDAFFSREAYPISHGNWDNRWKLSILPDKHIRWTVKTDNPSNSGIKDLDSKMVFEKKLVVHIVAVYDGSIVSIFINNQLDNSGSWSGLLLTTTFDLTIGQVLPNNSQYNFKGILDDVRIFDYALSSEEIQNLYQEQSSSVVEGRLGLPGSLFLEPNFPNPFNDKTAIRYRLDSRGRVLLTVYNLLGKPVRKLLDAEMAPGSHMIWWDGRDDGNLSVSTGMYVCTIKTVGFSDRIKILYIK